jgi:hypothetical protein
MPLTQAQILAMQSGIAQAVANNPKNIKNPIVNDPLEGGVSYGSGTGISNPANYWINPNPNPLPPRPEPTPTPTSGGTSVVAEPDLGTPTPAPTDTGTLPNTTTNPIKSLVNSLPPFLGGGGGGGGATDTATDTGVVTPAKPNYVLYIGILLAIIVAYKVFGKKTPTK